MAGNQSGMDEDLSINIGKIMMYYKDFDDFSTFI